MARNSVRAGPLGRFPDAELIGGRELGLGHSDRAANGAYVDLGRHVGRGVRVGGDLARDVCVGHRVDPIPVCRGQSFSRGLAQLFSHSKSTNAKLRLGRSSGKNMAGPPHTISAMNASMSASKASGVSHCGVWPAAGIVCTAPRHSVGMGSDAK
jgi:hypothetical protein